MSKTLLPLELGLIVNHDPIEKALRRFVVLDKPGSHFKQQELCVLLDDYAQVDLLAGIQQLGEGLDDFGKEVFDRDFIKVACDGTRKKRGRILRGSWGNIVTFLGQFAQPFKVLCRDYM